jgi:hypothetical protein
VQRGSKFCIVVVLDTALLSNFSMLSAYCTIACSLARQPYPAALQALKTAVGRHEALHTFNWPKASSLLQAFSAINKTLRF